MTPFTSTKMTLAVLLRLGVGGLGMGCLGVQGAAMDAPEPWQTGFQDPASAVMQGIINLHHDLMFFLTFVAVFVTFMLGQAVRRFSGQRGPENVVHGATIEIIWTVVPSLILVAIALPSFSLLYAMDALVDPTMTLKIVGHQWYWSYEYSDVAVETGAHVAFDAYMVPDDDLEAGQLRLLEVDRRVVLPELVPVRLLVTAADVLHSWAMPSLGIKVDAVPGRMNMVTLLADREGTFFGQCSEICGVNHGFMPIALDVVSVDRFVAWLAAQIQEAEGDLTAWSGAGGLAALGSAAEASTPVPAGLEAVAPEAEAVMAGAPALAAPVTVAVAHGAGVTRFAKTRGHAQRHPFHLVDMSPWPLIASFMALTMTFGGVMTFHGYQGGDLMFQLGMAGVVYAAVCWWRDIVREGTFGGHHTQAVQTGLRMGMGLFIASEVMFFLAFFWAFFHSALNPTDALGGIWPPAGVEPLNAWEVPLWNTVLLLSSGATVTWAHHALLVGGSARRSGIVALVGTVLLAGLFTALQGFEYVTAPFTMADNVYGSTFYMATGFHGIHVFLGTAFLAVCLARLAAGHFAPTHHVGFEAAAWYWHFVDVVWLFLFVTMYVWAA